MVNPHFLSGRLDLSDVLLDRASRGGMGLKLNVSTIRPSSLDPTSVAEEIGEAPVCFYRSLHAMVPSFRRHWLPRVIAPAVVIAALVVW